MISSDIRREARVKLTGKWGQAALITLVYAVITYVIQFLCNLIPVIGPFIALLITVPIGYGIIVSFIKLKRGEDVSLVQFLTDGFNSFSKAWSVSLNILLKMIVPIVIEIIFVIMFIGSVGMIFVGGISSLEASSAAGLAEAGGMFGFISIIGLMAVGIWITCKSFYYVLSFYILNDNEGLSGKEVVEKSAELMEGKRASYFWLSLSFIGWAILAVIPFGLGMLWLIPYIQIALVVFYEERAGIEDSNVQSDLYKEIES